MLFSILYQCNTVEHIKFSSFSFFSMLSYSRYSFQILFPLRKKQNFLGDSVMKITRTSSSRAQMYQISTVSKHFELHILLSFLHFGLLSSFLTIIINIITIIITIIIIFIIIITIIIIIIIIIIILIIIIIITMAL